MTDEQRAAIRDLHVKDRLFFSSYAERTIYGQLVMMGLARCYVKEDRSEWVRLATDEERALAKRFSAWDENSNVKETDYATQKL